MNIKKYYTAPIINFITLDNEISLALESTPPEGDDEVNNMLVPEHFNNDMFKSTNG